MSESIALCAYHGPGAPQHYESLRKVPNLNIASMGQCPIDVARSVLLEIALSQTKCDVFVFIDSDVSFPPEAYMQIVDSCIETKAVVAGCYLTKQLDGGQRVAGLFASDEEITFYENGGPQKALGVPMGFTAIHREAVAQIVEREPCMSRCTFLTGYSQEISAYPLFMPMIEAGAYLMEDYAFSRRAQRAGVGLFLDTRPRLQHYGPHGYRVTDIELLSADYSEAKIKFSRGRVLI